MRGDVSVARQGAIAVDMPILAAVGDLAASGNLPASV